MAAAFTGVASFILLAKASSFMFHLQSIYEVLKFFIFLRPSRHAQAMFCSGHREGDMVDVVYKRCEYPGGCEKVT